MGKKLKSVKKNLQSFQKNLAEELSVQIDENTKKEDLLKQRKDLLVIKKIRVYFYFKEELDKEISKDPEKDVSTSLETLSNQITLFDQVYRGLSREPMSDALLIQLADAVLDKNNDHFDNLSAIWGIDVLKKSASEVTSSSSSSSEEELEESNVAEKDENAEIIKAAEEAIAKANAIHERDAELFTDKTDALAKASKTLENSVTEIYIDKDASTSEIIEQTQALNTLINQYESIKINEEKVAERKHAEDSLKKSLTATTTYGLIRGLTAELGLAPNEISQEYLTLITNALLSPERKDVPESLRDLLEKNKNDLANKGKFNDAAGALKRNLLVTPLTVEQKEFLDLVIKQSADISKSAFHTATEKALEQFTDHPAHDALSKLEAEAGELYPDTNKINNIFKDINLRLPRDTQLPYILTATQKEQQKNINRDLSAWINRGKDEFPANATFVMIDIIENQKDHPLHDQFDTLFNELTKSPSNKKVIVELCEDMNAHLPSDLRIALPTAQQKQKEVERDAIKNRPKQPKEQNQEKEGRKRLQEIWKPRNKSPEELQKIADEQQELIRKLQDQTKQQQTSIQDLNDQRNQQELISQTMKNEEQNKRTFAGRWAERLNQASTKENPGTPDTRQRPIRNKGPSKTLTKKQINLKQQEKNQATTPTPATKNESPIEAKISLSSAPPTANATQTLPITNANATPSMSTTATTTTTTTNTVAGASPTPTSTATISSPTRGNDAFVSPISTSHTTSTTTTTTSSTTTTSGSGKTSPTITTSTAGRTPTSPTTSTTMTSSTSTATVAPSKSTSTATTSSPTGRMQPHGNDKNGKGKANKDESSPETRLADTEEQLNELIHALEKAKRKHEKYEDDYQYAMEQKNDLANTYTDLSSPSYIQEKKKLDHKIQAALVGFSDEQNNINDIQKQIKDLRTEWYEAAREVKSNREHEMQIERDDAAKNINLEHDKIKSNITETTDRLADLNGKSEAIKKAQLRATTDLSRFREEQTKLTIDLANLEKSNPTNTTAIDKLKNESAALDNEIKQLDATIQKINEDLEKNKTEIRHSEATLRQLNHELKETSKQKHDAVRQTDKEQKAKEIEDEKRKNVVSDRMQLSPNDRLNEVNAAISAARKLEKDYVNRQVELTEHCMLAKKKNLPHIEKIYGEELKAVNNALHQVRMQLGAADMLINKGFDDKNENAFYDAEQAIIPARQAYKAIFQQNDAEKRAVNNRSTTNYLTNAERVVTFLASKAYYLSNQAHNEDQATINAERKRILSKSIELERQLEFYLLKQLQKLERSDPNDDIEKIIADIRAAEILLDKLKTTQTSCRQKINQVATVCENSKVYDQQDKAFDRIDKILGYAPSKSKGSHTLTLYSKATRTSGSTTEAFKDKQRVGEIACTGFKAAVHQFVDKDESFVTHVYIPKEHSKKIDKPDALTIAAKAAMEHILANPTTDPIHIKGQASPEVIKNLMLVITVLKEDMKAAKLPVGNVQYVNHTEHCKNVSTFTTAEKEAVRKQLYDENSAIYSSTFKDLLNKNKRGPAEDAAKDLGISGQVKVEEEVQRHTSTPRPK